MLLAFNTLELPVPVRLHGRVARRCDGVEQWDLLQGTRAIGGGLHQVELLGCRLLERNVQLDHGADAARAALLVLALIVLPIHWRPDLLHQVLQRACQCEQQQGQRR